MDAFFASVEQRDNPSLKDLPVAVGGSGKRGVIAAASYEARKYGVYSAMPSRIALQKCPQLIFVKHRFPVYRKVSEQIRSIFHQYTDLVEPLSLDEAYLDVTENKPGFKSAIYIASKIKKEILEATHLTASAGVSINKFMAKIASDVNKPNGLTVILPEEVEEFIENLPIENFFGVGKATVKRMHRLQIFNGKDLKEKSLIELHQHFGKFGSYLYNVSRGLDNREVKPHRIRKSISVERTYSEDLLTREAVFQKLKELVEKLVTTLQTKNIKGRTINLKLRYSDFETLTRSRTMMHFLNNLNEIYEVCEQIVVPLIKEEKGIRLLGVGLSNLDNLEKYKQLELDF
jgi:DNA polymerase-4